MSDIRELRIRRLVYRASYTGMKETDLLLGQFAKKHLPLLTDEQLDLFEALLDAGDPSIFDWVKGDEDVPPHFDNVVLKLIKDYHINEI